MKSSASARPLRGPGGQPLLKPRIPGSGPNAFPREVGDPRTLKPRGPLRPTFNPKPPQQLKPPRVPWRELLLDVATPEVGVAALFLVPMGIVADHYLDRRAVLEQQPLFTPCGSEPHLREREMFPERRLSDMERLRRNLRWYADDDRPKGKLLERDIAALKTLIADQERQDQIRQIQTRLNGLNPGSEEARLLRQSMQWVQSMMGSLPFASGARASAGASTLALPASAIPQGIRDELLAAMNERQLQLRSRQVTSSVWLDSYVRKIFSENPQGAQLMVRLALSNRDDLDTFMAYANNGHVPSTAHLKRLGQFLSKMEDQGTHVTGDVLSTMTTEHSYFFQLVVSQQVENALQVHLEPNRYWVAVQGQPIRHVECMLLPAYLVSKMGINADAVNQWFQHLHSFNDRSIAQDIQMAFPIHDNMQVPSIDEVMAGVVLPPWIDHFQLSYVTGNPDKGATIIETRSLTQPVSRELPRTYALDEIDRLLAQIKFENHYNAILQREGTEALLFPNVPSFRYAADSDLGRVPIAIGHIRREMLVPQPLEFDVSQDNRELVALANLRRVVGSSIMETVLQDSAWQQSVRMDVQLLSPTLTQWIGEVRENGRHLFAVDSYLALVSKGLLALDPQVVQKFLPDSDQWTVAHQRLAYRLLLDPTTPQSLAVNALAKLHPVIMTDMRYVTLETPAETTALVMGGIELLVKWQDLSGVEVQEAAQFLRRMMATASPEVQRHAITTYVAVVNSGYLSDGDLRAGFANMNAIARRNPYLEQAVRGALLVLGAWVPRDTSAYLRVASAQVYFDDVDEAHVIPLAQLRTPFISPPPILKPSWSNLWPLINNIQRDPVLSEAARAFGVTPYTLWSPLLDESRLALEMSEKIEQTMADPSLDAADRAYLEAQRDVVIDFFSSQRRRQFWLQIAHGNDVVAKSDLVALLEQRLKTGGTVNELTEVQQVRNVALGLPELSFEAAAFERKYLKNLTILSEYRPIKWGMALDVFSNVQDVEVAYATSVLMHGRFVRDIPRKLQQLVALRILWGVGGKKSADYYDVLYHSIAPLMDSDDTELAYAAAVTAQHLQRRGAQEVDVERVHALVPHSVWERLASGDYKDDPEDMLKGLALLVQQGEITDQQIVLVLGVILQVLRGYNETAIGLAVALYLSLLETHEDEVSKGVDVVANALVQKIDKVHSREFRAQCLDALERLVTHIPIGQKTYRELRYLVQMNDLASWVGRVRKIMEAIESNSQ